VALIHGCEKAALALIKKGAKINKKTPDGWSPLYLSLRNGCEKAALLLIEKGADVNKKDPGKRWSLLHFALRYGCEKAALLLIEKGANVNEKDPRKRWSPLHFALKYGCEKAALLLIEKGANVNEKTFTSNRTPLHLALRHGYDEVVLALIEKGAKVSESDRNGWNSFHFASYWGRFEAYKNLIQESGDLYDIFVMLDQHQNSPFHLAAKKWQERILYLQLINDNTKFDAKNSQENTAVDLAGPHKEKLNWLIKNRELLKPENVNKLTEKQLEGIKEHAPLIFEIILQEMSKDH